MKKLILIIFVIVAGVQLYVPASMIFSRETVIIDGEAFLFKSAPVDPSDPFRGKYITLSYEATEYELDGQRKDTIWEIGETVYVLLGSDDQGYAKILDVLKKAPLEGNYVEASLSHKIPYEDPEKIFIEYPFNRFYMEESKAYDAEVMYRESQIDTAKTTYALVHVKDGEAVISDVLIDGISVVDLVRQQQQE